MKRLAFLLLAACTLVTQACSKDSVKRTGYETVRNLGERQCLEDLSGKCPQRENYDDYQRRLDEQQR